MRLGVVVRCGLTQELLKPEGEMKAKTKPLYVVRNEAGQYWSEHYQSWQDYCWAKLYPRKSLANTVADEVGGQACTTRQAIDQIVKRIASN